MVNTAGGSRNSNASGPKITEDMKKVRQIEDAKIQPVISTVPDKNSVLLPDRLKEPDAVLAGPWLHGDRHPVDDAQWDNRTPRTPPPTSPFVPMERPFSC